MYVGGAYGSWIEWLLWYGHETQWEMVNSSQLLPDGSSHSRRPEEFEKIEGYEKIKHPIGYFETEEAILHARSITDVDLLTYRCIIFQSKKNNYSIRDAIDLVGNSNFTGIYIDINNNDMQDIVFLNTEKKITPLFSIVAKNTPRNIEMIRQWNPAADSIFDLELWERRELFSMAYTGMYQDQLNVSLEDIPPSVLVINIDDILCGNVTELVRKMFDHAKMPLREEALVHIKQEHVKMLSLQESIRELKAIKTIVDACLAKQNISMQPISSMGEAIVQRRLRDHGVDLHWYGLNDWPTETGKLIERMIDKS
jgi:hypothetical protein